MLTSTLGALRWTARSPGWIAALLLPTLAHGFAVGAWWLGLVEATTVAVSLQETSILGAVVSGAWTASAVARMESVTQPLPRRKRLVGPGLVFAVGLLLTTVGIGALHSVLVGRPVELGQGESYAASALFSCGLAAALSGLGPRLAPAATAALAWTLSPDPQGSVHMATTVLIASGTVAALALRSR